MAFRVIVEPKADLDLEQYSQRMTWQFTHGAGSLVRYGQPRA
jgi:hypothetical protein